MKKQLIIAMLLIAGVASATPYFGAYRDQVNRELHPSRNTLDEVVIKNIGIALANSPNWVGTPKQAHRLVRRSVIDSLGINVPEGADLDVEPTLAEKRESDLRTRLLKSGYNEAEIDSFMVQFRALTHPAE